MITTRRDLPVHPNIEYRQMGELSALDMALAQRLVEGVDAVIHAAGHAHAGAQEAIHRRVNHHATACFARAAAHAGIGLVYLSSIKAMGPPDRAGYLHEGSISEPEDAYGRSKAAAERDIRAALPLNHVILRPALVAGQGAKGNLAALLRLARLPVPLPFANGSARRSLISRHDLAGLAVQALDASDWQGKSLIAADPDPLSLGEIIAALRNGRSAGLFPMPEPVLATMVRFCGLSQRADQLFSSLIAVPTTLLLSGWVPQQPVRQALQAMAAQKRLA